MALPEQCFPAIPSPFGIPCFGASGFRYTSVLLGLRIKAGSSPKNLECASGNRDEAAYAESMQLTVFQIQMIREQKNTTKSIKAWGNVFSYNLL